MVTCSLRSDPNLFRAALVSLGALGIIIRLKMRAAQHYNIEHTTEIVSLSRFLTEYNQIWTSATYVKAWWWPYSQEVVVWRGNRTQSPSSPPRSAGWWRNLQLGRKIHEMSLFLLTHAPSHLPWFEKVLFRALFPADEILKSGPVIGNPHEALQIDCLFSQYVDEWAIALNDGPAAIKRLDNWIRFQDTSTRTGIPMDTDRAVFVHAPIEIRVTTGVGDYAYLSPAYNAPTPLVYIGVTMYRPYYTPTAYRQYFLTYEHLMRMYKGKPHWAKQHRMGWKEAREVFGEGMEKWLRVRERVDPDGMFVNGFIKRHLLGNVDDRVGVGTLDGESGRLYKRFKAAL